MLVKDARNAAKQWVLAHGVKTMDFAGSFFHGSINALPANTELPPSSDVDVMVVLDTASPPNKPGKFIYHGVLLEVSYISSKQLARPELVLSHYQLATSFRLPSVIWDPSGRLSELQAEVSKDFAKRHWVIKRCLHARDKVLTGHPLDADAPFFDQVNSWLFPTGILTHILLVAGLENPTVRRRYLATRQLLSTFGHFEVYQDLLELLGCTNLSGDAVNEHLVTLTAAFDAAKTVKNVPFFFASDISDIARPIAIDGSRALITAGYHREAIFWMVATYSRCLKILYHCGHETSFRQASDGYWQLLASLGIHSLADLRQRCAATKSAVPTVFQVALAIISANAKIED